MKFSIIPFLTMLFIAWQAYGEKGRIKYIPGADTLAVPSASYARYSYYIRIQLDGQTIDLFSNNGGIYQGVLINQITSYRSVIKEYGRSSQAAFVYYQRLLLDTVVSTNIAHQIIASGQDTIPTDSLIKSWKNGWPDCNIIWFKFRVNGVYNNQRFICLGSQSDTLQYKKTIVSNLTYLYKVLDLDSVYSTFEASVPRGFTYSKDAFTFTHFPTHHQIRKWNKLAPHMAYMTLVRDTLNKYLSDTLTSLLAAKDFKCYNQFFLRLSKHSKLLKITTNRIYKDRDKEEEDEYNQCKEKIFDAFNSVKVDFIKPQHGYFKELVYQNGRVVIRQ